MRPESPLQWHSPEHVTKSLQRIYKVLRRNVSYGTINDSKSQNMDGVWVKVTTPNVANTQFTVNHTLNRVPVGFHVMTKNGATDVYQGPSAWTKTQIFLMATGTNVNLTLFIF